MFLLGNIFAKFIMKYKNQMIETERIENKIGRCHKIISILTA